MKIASPMAYADTDGWFAGVGMFFGVAAAGIAFFAMYIAAISSVGWVIGIALGWIPASIALIVTFFVFRYLWWLILVVIVLVALHAMG